jgi:hypothetical protein
MDSIKQNGRKRKPKTNRKGETGKSAKFDQCQTPHYALDPLLPFLSADAVIWESACGEGQMADKLTKEGYQVVGTDILNGYNFLDESWSPVKPWDIQVSNPPYSIKYDWLRHSYYLQKPFALLLPLETLGAAQAQAIFSQFGIEIILLSKRVNFRMPGKGYSGKGAQFPVCWMTWGLNIGRQLTFAPIGYYSDSQIPLFNQPFIQLEPQLSLFEEVAA